MRRLFLKLRRRARLQADLEAEMTFHREMAAAGGNPTRFGNTLSIRDQALDLWRFRFIEDLWRDLAYAARGIARSPGFAITTILTLALGIGANTSIFSIVSTYLLRPMPAGNPASLVAVYLTAPRWSYLGDLSYPDLLDYRKQATALSDVMGSTGIGLSMTAAGGGNPEMIWGEVVTGNYFSGLGVRPILGRGFLPEEDRAPGERAVCVLNYHFWQNRFHGDLGIIGQSIRINGHAFTVVGVAPHGFIGTMLFNFVPDVWVPVMMQQTIASNEGNYLAGRDNRWISTRARLKPGVTRQQAETQLNVIAQQLAHQYPDSNRDIRVHVIAGGARTQPFLAANGAMANTVALLTGVVILVLVIACTNAGNLMLARAQARTREMAVRISLGAGRGRLIRQLLAESLLLSLAAGAVGLVMAVGFSRMLANFYPSLDYQTADLDYEMQFDPRIVLFTFGISVLTALLFGLVPALRASKTGQAAALRGAGGSSDRGPLRIGRGNLLVFAQVCVSSLLLIAGGLFLRSMQYSHNADLGFDRSGILMFSIDLDRLRYEPEQGRRLERALIGRMRTIPGVATASLAFPLPLDAYGQSTLVLPEGYVPPSDRERNEAKLSKVAPGYFSTMGTALVAGRAIDERDTKDAPRVAVINETLARRYWQTAGNAIGRRFRIGPKQPWIEVAGVARDGKYEMIGEPATPYLFLPIEQDYQGRVTVLLRSSAPREVLAPAIRAEVAALDPAVPIFGMRTAPEFLNRLLSVYDMGASLLGSFAAAALLLSAAGIFGVVHFTVLRRTREIGIRVALGASRQEVIRLVLGRSMAFVTAGVAIGVGLALAASGLTGSLIAGVRGSDPLTLVGSAAMFLLVALAATLVPARRAVRVDPMTALREE